MLQAEVYGDNLMLKMPSILSVKTALTFSTCVQVAYH